MKLDELEDFFASNNIHGELLGSSRWLGIISSFIRKEDEYFLYIIKNNEIKKMERLLFNGTWDNFSKKTMFLKFFSLFFVDDEAFPNDDLYIDNLIEGYCEMYQNIDFFTTEENIHNWINQKIDEGKFSPAVGFSLQESLLRSMNDKQNNNDDDKDDDKSLDFGTFPKDNGKDDNWLEAIFEENDNFGELKSVKGVFKFVPENLKIEEICLAAIQQVGRTLEK